MGTEVALFNWSVEISFLIPTNFIIIITKVFGSEKRISIFVTPFEFGVHLNSYVMNHLFCIVSRLRSLLTG